MKKIFTLAAILISMSVATFAADRPKNGKISVTSNTNSTIFVKVDGKKYDLNRNEFVLNSIMPGKHRVEIYTIERTGLFRAMRTKVLYSDFISIAPDQAVNLNVNRLGNVVVKKSGLNTYDRDNKWDHDYGRNDRNDHNDRGNGKKW